MAIGAALLIGRQDAMAAAETEQPIGSRYNSEFGSWLARYHFDNIDKGDSPDRGNRHLPAIEAWRATLTQTAYLRLNHPSSIVADLSRTTPSSRGKSRN
jgi:hypothetical protein